MCAGLDCNCDDDRLVFEVFEGWAYSDADRIALLEGSRRLSYGELNAYANRLARWLRDRGVGPDAVVGLHLERSVDLVVASLAVLKAGGAYLPIDPANPPARAMALLADADARLVLCGVDAARLRGGAAEPVRIDAIDLTEQSTVDPTPVAQPGDLAYVVYTSGSTGSPKGVAVTHEALAHLVRRVGAGYGLGPADRAGLVCSPSFDVSVSEVWLPLTHGACLDIAGAELLLSPEATIRWLADRGITITVLPTPLAERALQARWPAGPTLRTLLTGGDRLHVRPDPTLPFRLVNNYGPTENTVISTFGSVPVRGGDGPPGLPGIGRPVPGTTVEVLDAELRPCEANQVGEIYLGGAQLARGYVGRPGLTADRFVPHPYATRPGDRLYRTGDLGRWLPSGELEFVGRVDDQVKLRGHRIELGEITATLTGHPGVREAHVLLHEAADDARLVAYVAPTDLHRLPAASALRRYLAERLPAFMVPASYVIVEALPLNTNGKVDRTALPEPELRRLGDPERYVAPHSATEVALAAIWREVLRLDRIGTRDSFLDLGGHSLLATQIAARVAEQFTVDIAVRAVFDRPTIAEFAAEVDALRAAGVNGEPALPPVEPGSGPVDSPLSLAQQQVVFLEGLAPGNAAYRAQATIRVTGPLDMGVLAQVLTEITRRHESLRTTYHDRDGQHRQVVQPPTAYPLRRVDLTGDATADREAALARVLREEMDRDFDLETLPLSRWTAVRLGPEEHELIMVEHHLVHDGWSFGVLLREMEVLYNAYLQGDPSPLPELAVQFRDYVRWQQELVASPIMAGQLAYWRDRLAGARELALPTDRPRPKVQGFRGSVLRLEVPTGLATAIRELGRRDGVSPFMAMYAGFAALLHRYTGETDITVASAFANRRRPETEALIGMLVNPVALRTEVRGTMPFRTLLASARDVVLAAAVHQECPFPLVVKALGLDRDSSRNPLAQVMFSAHDSAVRYPQFADATSTVFERSNDTAKMDLNVIVVPRAKGHLGRREHTDDRITILWEYDRDLFDADTMHAMSGAYLRLLTAAVADPDTPVGRLPVLTAEEVRTTLVDWNPGLRCSPTRPDPPVHEQVAAWARSTPHALAVAEGGRRLTYAELNERAERFATRLRAADLGPEDVVALCLPRGADVIAAELGVLKSGTAFLPVDPTNPEERIRQIVANSGARLVVTSLEADLDPDALAPPISPPVRVRPGDLAYVIYTSGSTGEPKGVLVQHDALASFVAWHRRRFALTPDDRTTVVGSPGFDLSIWECWPTLTAGGSLHVPATETLLSGPDLRQWLVDEQITVGLFPTPLAELLLAQDWPDTGRLRCLHAGGDRLTVRPPDGLGFEVYNAYGPTETTVLSTVGIVAPEAGQPNLPDIGRPIDGNTAYLLDAELNPVPRGAIGEIYLGGVELARGYLGRPDLTADRFVPDPIATRPGAHLYRTGDLGRHLHNGTIEFVGRRDNQIQIRGHRVEPAEVTAALRTHPTIRDAYTAARTDPVSLAAYLVPAPGATMPSVAELRDYVGRRLPPWLQPTAYVVLDDLPRTRSGKVDHRALPAPPEPTAHASAAPPATRSEQILAEIWAEVLGRERVGVQDRFFDLGGHSLLLPQVRNRILRDLGRNVPLVALFEHPTISSLASYLERGRDAVDSDLGELRRGGLHRLRQRRTTVDGAVAGR